MALSPLYLSLRVAAAAICVYGASCQIVGAAGTAARPLVLAQMDPDAAPDDSQGGGGAAALLIRVERLEDRLRSLTGQVEQLQYQNKKLEDELRKMQQDVDFRFQDLGRAPPAAGRPAPQKRSDAGESGDTTAVAKLDGAASPVIADTPESASPAKPARRVGDAFDPSSDPNAPGAPRPLGTTPPSPPLPTGSVAASRQAPASSAIIAEPHAPLDLTPTSVNPAHPAASPSSPIQEAAITPDAGVRGTLPPPSGGATGSRGEYESDVALFKGGRYDAAIEGFQGFLDKNPKDRLVPDATYFLGESYARLGRHREAAEQFLKLSTDYTKSARAPDALLRLGVALNALGAKDQACATYQEVDRKYPAAPSDVRANVERELKRAKC